MEKSGVKLIYMMKNMSVFFPVCFISVLILTLVKFFFLKAEKDNKRLKICPHNPLMNCELFNPVLLRYHIP